MTNAQNSGAVELLPCPNPWCEADERNGDFRPQVQYSNFGMVYVACTSCTMAGPTRQHEVDAITAWNTRATPSPSDQVGWQAVGPALVEALRWIAENDETGPTYFEERNGRDWPVGNMPGKFAERARAALSLLPTAPTLTAGEGGVDGTR